MPVKEVVKHSTLWMFVCIYCGPIHFFFNVYEENKKEIEASSLGEKLSSIDLRWAGKKSYKSVALYAKKYTPQNETDE